MSEKSRGASSSDAHNDAFTALLKKLDLHKYYPGKMKREDFGGLMDEELDETKIEKTEDLGRIFLDRLLSCNYAARDLDIIPESTSKPSVTVTEEEKPGIESSIFAQIEKFSSSPTEPQSQTAIHPLDVVLSVFLCADPILQQDIATLLWKCKLAIPFITPISKDGIPVAHVWPLRNICARWTVKRNEKEVLEEDSIILPPFLTIGFMRLESTEVKKSITINTLLSDTEKSHPIFYHRNSIGSTKKRLIANGVVEISWKLPNSSGENMCNEPITVLNLRGDAQMYPIQQQILIEMVSLCFIVCKYSEINSKAFESIMEKIRKMKKKVFVITEADQKFSVIECKDDTVIFNKKILTDATLKENIKSQLKKLKSKHSLQRRSIDTFSWKDVSVDLEIPIIKNGLQQAEIIMKSLLSERKEDRKDKLLPIHQALWEKWVETEKEMYRLKKILKSQDRRDYINQLQMEKDNIRKKQLQIVKRGVSDAISNFLKALNISDNVTRAVCVRWLRIRMDRLYRSELPWFVDQENKIYEKMSTLKDKHKAVKEKLDLENIQALRNKSHIGLEHFFREIGQIYEANETQAPKDRYNIRYDLPLLAARFLLDGNSLEIFDGDVGAVPITWVSAVLIHLTDMLKKQTGRENPKCIVLTVYGMQSSGKSTLLNTMFGCQFTVGAGRVTKGAQIQLLKVNDNIRKSINVDYILLVDTEGVRSPEMAEEIRKSRDNEITTFVIGLGQKTLINVMGENMSYLTEVLPIAVRAFLRMEGVGLKPACAIVYQNVDSQSRTEIARQNEMLQEQLDSQTHSACQMEKKEQKDFHNVIQFDVKNDVHYISSLWEGEPPMATVSQAYSKGVLKLKKNFLQFCKQCTSQDLASYSSYVESLWRAIAKDDFVYFFRNTLETKAREKLDKCWCQVVWELRKEGSKCEPDIQNAIMDCQNIEELEKISNTSRNNISVAIASAYEKQKKCLENFFDDTHKKYKTYMIEWKASTIDNLDNVRKTVHEDQMRIIERLRRLQETQVRTQIKLKEISERIKNNITEYCKMKENQTDSIEHELPETEIRRVFEEKWKEWVSTDKSVRDEQRPKSTVAMDALGILKEKFRSHNTLLTEKSEALLSGKQTEFHLQTSHLITNTKDANGRTYILAKTNVEKTIESVRKCLNELTKDPSPYRKGSLEEILQMVEANENKLRENDVKTTMEFEIDISSYVLSMAVSSFTESEKKFFDSHDLVHLLDEKKKTFLVLFETNYKTVNFTRLFAKRVSELLMNANIERVKSLITKQVADDIKTNVFFEVLQDKKSLIYTILCRMARDGIFSHFLDYIRNPAQTIYDWLARYVDEYSSADGGNPSKLLTLANRLVQNHLNELTACVEDTEQHTGQIKVMDKTKEIPVKVWVEKFTERASKHFTMNDIRGLSDTLGEKMINCFYFKTELFQCINAASPDIEERINKLINKEHAFYQTMRGEVVKLLGDIGCTETCPFCGEICGNAQKGHQTSHETSVHRPLGCNGYPEVNSRILDYESCQKLVAGDRLFRNSKTNGKFVPFKEYLTVHNDWKIPGDADPKTSSFWEWFMFTYITDLEKTYEAVKPTLPEFWKNYSKENVIEKLKNEMK